METLDSPKAYRISRGGRRAQWDLSQEQILQAQIMLGQLRMTVPEQNFGKPRSVSTLRFGLRDEYYDASRYPRTL